MAQPLTLIESPPAAPIAAPQCRGRGGLARRADDRQPAGRGHPAQAPPRAFLRAAARPHLRADPRLPRPQHDRQPGHAAAVVRGGRGDEGARRPGLSRPAHRQRRGDHRRARFRRADLRSRLAPRAGRRRPRDGREGARHREEVDPKGQIEQAEAALYRVAEEGGGEGGVKTFAQATAEAVQMAEKALNTGGGLSGITTGLETSTPRPAASTTAISSSSPAVRAWARPRSPPTSPSTRRGGWCRTSRTASPPSARPAPASPSSASKCRPISSPPASSPSNPGSAPKCCAWARSASRISATSPAPPPISKACRSISTTRPASPSRRCAPARGG